MPYMITLRKSAYSDEVSFIEREVDKFHKPADFRWNIEGADTEINKHRMRRTDSSFSDTPAFTYTQSYTCCKSLINSEEGKAYLKAFFLGEINLHDIGYYE